MRRLYPIYLPTALTAPPDKPVKFDIHELRSLRKGRLGVLRLYPSLNPKAC